MNIQTTIDYLFSLKTKYQWSAKTWKSIEEDICRLSVRNNDKCLYLGVAGEFSSGKSTLINALLGHHLLKEDVLQGTTCAPTFLRFGKQFDVIIEFANGPIQILSETSEFKTVYKQILAWFEKIQKSGNKGAIQIPREFSAIQEFIDKHTAVEAMAKNILRTTIYLNTPILQSGLVIVDTPGINAENPRHGLVAETAIKEYCDAVLVLVPASEPCSGVLCNFVRNHLQGIQCSSLAIVTKIDGIRERERNRMLKFVRERLESETDTDFADVLSCAAMFALGDDPESKLSTEKQEELREQFNSMVQKVIHYLESSREAIINRKLYQILKNLIPQIKKQLQKKQKEFEARKNVLENSQLIDLDSYISYHKEIFRNGFQKLFVSSSDFERAMREDLFYWIQENTSVAESSEELKDIVELFKNCIPIEWGIICEEIDDECHLFYDRAAAFCNGLKDHFNQEYRNLYKNYSQPVSLDTLSVNNGNVVFELPSEPIQITEDIIAEEDRLIGGGIVKGTLTGVAIGSFIPGIGTILGGIVGGVVGLFKGLLSFNQDEMNEKVATALVKAYIQEIEPKIKTEISNRIWNHKTSAKRSVENWLDSLKWKYGPQIAELIAEQEEEQKHLDSLIQAAVSDLYYLEANERNIGKFLGK